MNLRQSLILIVVSVFMSTHRANGSAAQDGVAITYLANEGVMLSGGGRRVLIDGLFSHYDGYPVAPDSTRYALDRAFPPFDSVNLVLATHRHGDHFHPASVTNHLKSNLGAIFVASQQVIDSLGKYPASRSLAASRLLSRTTPPGEQKREVFNGVRVHILGLSHGSGRHRNVQHLGYVVEIGGRRVLHTGDSDFNEDDYRRLRLDTLGIDVALLPQWAVIEKDPQRIVRTWIKPRAVVAIHMETNADESSARRVQAAFPGATAFVRKLEVTHW